MKCSNQGCKCVVDTQRKVEGDAKEYCYQKCANECSAESCVCAPCDCAC